jgi:hypothetical protein
MHDSNPKVRQLLDSKYPKKVMHEFLESMKHRSSSLPWTLTPPNTCGNSHWLIHDQDNWLVCTVPTEANARLIVEAANASAG